MWLRVILVRRRAGPGARGVRATLCCPKNGRGSGDDGDAVNSYALVSGLHGFRPGNLSAAICLGADIKVATTLKPRLSDLGITRDQRGRRTS